MGGESGPLASRPGEKTNKKTKQTEPASAEERSRAGGRRRGRPGPARGLAPTPTSAARWASSPAWAAAGARPATRGPGRAQRPRPRCTLGSPVLRPPARPGSAGRPGGGGLWLAGGQCFLYLSFYFFFLSFFFRPRGLRGPPLPESPRKRLLGVGAAGWRTLRWRWAWPGARAGGAVARQPPSSLAARAAPGAGEPRSRERAAGSQGWSRGREDPRPKRPARWVGA